MAHGACLPLRRSFLEADLVTHFAVLSNSQEDEAVFREAL